MNSKGRGGIIPVSWCISAAAGATYSNNGYLAGFTWVVINWLRWPTTFQNLLLLRLCKRGRIYPATQTTSWTTVGDSIYLERFWAAPEKKLHIKMKCLSSFLEDTEEARYRIWLAALCYMLDSAATEILSPVTMSGIPLGWSVCGPGQPCSAPDCTSV